jgi:hypothetical protein
MLAAGFSNVSNDTLGVYAPGKGVIGCEGATDEAGVGDTVDATDNMDDGDGKLVVLRLGDELACLSADLSGEAAIGLCKVVCVAEMDVDGQASWLRRSSKAIVCSRPPLLPSPQIIPCSCHVRRRQEILPLSLT